MIVIAKRAVRSADIDLTDSALRAGTSSLIHHHCGRAFHRLANRDGTSFLIGGLHEIGKLHQRSFGWTIKIDQLNPFAEDLSPALDVTRQQWLAGHQNVLQRFEIAGDELLIEQRTKE